MIWHNEDANSVLNELNVDKSVGLSNGEADARLQEYGQNIISKIDKPTFLEYFLKQIKSKVLISLIVISLLSFFVSLIYDEVNSYSAILIIGIVLINALISAYYIYSCNNSLEGIKQITNPTAKVLRDGILKSVNSSLLVPGDIIILEEGDYIPADARIIECNEFRCNEAVLTGIEVPIDKISDITFEDITAIEERSNMVFSGTSVVHGNAKAVITQTGINTEVGRTSAILQQTGNDKLPIENKLDGIGKVVNLIILLICVLFFIINLIQNFNTGNFASMTLKTLMNTVALAVAAIPEGLPAITTIVIAIGTARILKQNIILKDASSAELLGKTDIICCDKTGVLTRNKMVLSKIYDGVNLYDIENDGVDEKSATIIKLATVCSTLKNDSTENAIEKACLTYNSMSKTDIDAHFPHITEIPFDSERKTMSVFTMINEKPFIIVKGAPETVIPNCVGCDGEDILKANTILADEAYRNVCIAMKPLDSIPANPSAEDVENNLTFVGLLALNDPPREQIVDNIAECHNAGIKTVMITGDNPNTAKAIARRIGILQDGQKVLTGEELATLTDEELYTQIEDITVFARISPSDKVRIIKAFQHNKKIVTVTGDSVEDADALAVADVGCAIGKFGADVAKGNSDIIIFNNKFESILSAVKESRGLFSNISKSINYLFTCNFAEIFIMLLGVLLFGNLPITAVLLLWINLLTDSAPAISLSMEAPENNCMSTKSHAFTGKIFDLKSIISITLQTVAIMVLTLVSFVCGNNFGDVAVSQTMAFVTLGIIQIFHCYNCKFTGSLFGKKVFSNKLMNYSAIITLFIVIFLAFTPAGFVFGMTKLSFSKFIISFVLALLIIPITEVIKFTLNKLIVKS